MVAHIIISRDITLMAQDERWQDDVSTYIQTGTLTTLERWIWSEPLHCDFDTTHYDVSYGHAT